MKQRGESGFCTRRLATEKCLELNGESDRSRVSVRESRSRRAEMIGYPSASGNYSNGNNRRTIAATGSHASGRVTTA
jgi:hypothetical protein